MKLLIMFYGLPVSGKSTLAQEMQKHFSDVVSLKTVDLQKLSSPTIKDFDETVKETRNQKDQSYQTLLAQAKRYIQTNNIVILDATFHQLHRRIEEYKLVQEFHLPLLVMHCSCDNLMVIQHALEKRKQSNKKDDLLKSYEMYQLMKHQSQEIIPIDAKHRSITKK